MMKFRNTAISVALLSALASTATAASADSGDGNDAHQGDSVAIHNTGNNNNFTGGDQFLGSNNIAGTGHMVAGVGAPVPSTFFNIQVDQNSSDIVLKSVAGGVTFPAPLPFTIQKGTSFSLQVQGSGTATFYPAGSPTQTHTIHFDAAAPQATCDSLPGVWECMPNGVVVTLFSD
ncbi:hypothetical protein ABT187_45755 [Streptomyces sp. NPDC001817]|uniref:hypothetical protein n=1 Tax=Streptomyces sp. NPDC001817 TaxID=3154398 RepID=UPI003319CB3F